jgi:accessory gene regulator B
MIQKLAVDMTDLFVRERIVEKNDSQVYAYAFELLISTVINLAFVFTVALFLRNVLETILFLAAFIPLRVLAGGFHAKTHWLCILVFTLGFCILVWLMSLIPSNYLGVFILIEGFLLILRM